MDFDDVLLALTAGDDETTAGEVLERCTNAQIRAIFLEYVKRHERGKWFGPHQYPNGARLIQMELSWRVDPGRSTFCIGRFTAAYNWQGLYQDAGEFFQVDGGYVTLLRWRYLPEYPGEGK